MSIQIFGVIEKYSLLLLVSDRAIAGVAGKTDSFLGGSGILDGTFFNSTFGNFSLRTGSLALNDVGTFLSFALKNLGSGDTDRSFSITLSLFCLTKTFFNSGFLNEKSGDVGSGSLAGGGATTFFSGTNSLPCGLGGGGS